MKPKHKEIVFDIIANAMPGIGNDLVNELVRVAPVDTGFLRNSIDYTYSKRTVTIHMPSYAMYVEFGTAPHEIRAINKKSLHWKKDGVDFFAKVIHHPGTQPNPFIRTTINTKLRDIIIKNIKMSTERYTIGGVNLGSP